YVALRNSFFDAVELWETASGKRRGTMRPEEPGKGGTVLAPNGHWAAVGTNAPVAVWDRRGKEPRLMYADRGVLGSLSASPSSEMLAVGEDNGSVRLWSMRTGQLL